MPPTLATLRGFKRTPGLTLITALDPVTFAAVALTFAIVAMGAAYVPARRATTIDPLVAVRHE